MLLSVLSGSFSLCLIVQQIAFILLPKTSFICNYWIIQIKIQYLQPFQLPTTFQPFIKKKKKKKKKKSPKCFSSTKTFLKIIFFFFRWRFDILKYQTTLNDLDDYTKSTPELHLYSQFRCPLKALKDFFKGVVYENNKTFFKELTLCLRTYELRSQREKKKCTKWRQTPHTVLQKLPRGKKCTKRRQPHTVLQKIISKSGNHPLKWDSEWRGWLTNKLTFFKTLTPHLWASRPRGKKMYQMKTNASHCPTKTISKNVNHPLKYYTVNSLWCALFSVPLLLKNF